MPFHRRVPHQGDHIWRVSDILKPQKEIETRASTVPVWSDKLTLSGLLLFKRNNGLLLFKRKKADVS